VLSDARRAEIRVKLENFIQDYNTKYQVDIRHLFLHLFWHMEKPHNPTYVKSFKGFSLRLDRIRGESTLSVIPEIAELFE
jgi:hypothetical protein